MPDHTESRHFLTEGLTHYGNAIRATSVFRGQVRDILQEALEAAERKRTLKALKSRFYPDGGSPDDPYFGVYREAPGKPGTYLCLGIEWAPLAHLYAGLWRKENAPTMGDPSKGANLTKDKDGYLTRPILPDRDLREQIDAFIRDFVAYMP